MFERKFTINDEVLEALSTVQKEVSGIDNGSQALRYLVLENYRDYEDEKNRIGRLSRDVSILIEQVSSLSDSLNTKMVDSDLTDSYNEALEIVKDKKKKQSATFRKRV